MYMYITSDNEASGCRHSTRRTTSKRETEKTELKPEAESQTGAGAVAQAEREYENDYREND
jgi:hypothetical protein